ncbi:MAG: nicotinate-nucleotide diphosphorylase (carboxylating) [Candidatus Pelagibacter sp.]|nr:nicotinate-nucleotide diphosphorylase (carboxylating) [Candidatus Pelagibacter sp.]
MYQIKLTNKYINNCCKLALDEDLNPSGDITSNLIKNNNVIKAKLISNDNGIIGGLNFVKSTFRILDNKIKFTSKKKDGFKIKKGELVATIKGNVKNILIGERTALNFLSHISGIATKTNKFVRLVNNKTKICCTRKTIPSLRILQKYAVKLGGGTNHRFNLSDEFLIKDNHITVENLKKLINRAIKLKKRRKITVEIDKISQLKKIVGLKIDTVLFDNMTLNQLKKSVKIAKKYYETEASGNITLKNVKSVAATGVDRISVGSLTHTIKAHDFKIEI